MENHYVYYSYANTTLTLTPKVLSNQLTQTIDAINYAKTQITNYSYNSTNLLSYMDDLVTALAYDVVFLSNYQSIVS